MMATTRSASIDSVDDQLLQARRVTDALDRDLADFDGLRHMRS
jgi:hypothetical protein